MLQNEVDVLRSQLTIARNEINKLRQQVKNLQHVQRKDIDSVTQLLQDFRCEGCRQNDENTRNRNEVDNNVQNVEHNAAAAGFRPIGVIRTAFAEKRAVPRQPSVGGRLRGVIELNSDVFTNPSHALQGLVDYSHLWIIFHFHKNQSHPKAKVAPPRLGGERVGVFATRSPHRPCPLGLSLVEIAQIEGTRISFYGTDMVDGTPVLDIKPYIPHYDAPDGGADAGITTDNTAARILLAPSETTSDFYTARQEPDGEESELELLGANGGVVGAGSITATATAADLNAAAALPPPAAVRVPNWVVAQQRLQVCFNAHAEEQLRQLPQLQRQCIVDILAADPRSVYLRTKHGSQIFTFQLSEVTVTCKFDDKAEKVTVVQIRRTEHLQQEQEEQQQQQSQKQQHQQGAA